MAMVMVMPVQVLPVLVMPLPLQMPASSPFQRALVASRAFRLATCLAQIRPAASAAHIVAVNEANVQLVRLLRHQLAELGRDLQHRVGINSSARNDLCPQCLGQKPQCRDVGYALG